MYKYVHCVFSIKFNVSNVLSHNLRVTLSICELQRVDVMFQYVFRKNISLSGEKRESYLTFSVLLYITKPVSM